MCCHSTPVDTHLPQPVFNDCRVQTYLPRCATWPLTLQKVRECLEAHSMQPVVTRICMHANLHHSKPDTMYSSGILPVRYGFPPPLHGAPRSHTWYAVTLVVSTAKGVLYYSQRPWHMEWVPELPTDPPALTLSTSPQSIILKTPTSTFKATPTFMYHAPPEQPPAVSLPSCTTSSL